MATHQGDAQGHTGDHACRSHDHGADVATQARPSGRTFKVSGLDCAEEVAVLRREIGPLVGGEDHLAFDVLNGRMTVAEAARHVPDRDITAAVQRTGMSASRWQPGRDEDGADERHRRLQVWLTTASGLSVLIGLVLHAWLAGGIGEALRLLGHSGQAMPLPEILAYAFAVAFGVRYVLVKAWYAARRLRPDINLLMVIAITGAIGIGEWFEAATVAFLFSLSLTLESWSIGRARRAISALLDLSPPTVHALAATGEEREIAAAEAPVGTRFIVRPGERIALDGCVVGGTSAVDQAPITGESVPVAKEPGGEVFAGTINGDGALEVESTKVAEDTTLARITRMVEQAHSRRARAEQWVEKFARVYTPAVIALALAICVVPPVLFDAAWGDWFYRALVLLVIACPCALVISTPVSIVAALAASAREGVLIKGGTYVEQPAALRAMAFDKTGTLSWGRPAVVEVVPFDGYSEPELIERATALEARSTHPLAKAIIAYGERRGIEIAPAEGVQVLQGKGVVGRSRGETFWLGSHRYLVERGQETSEVVHRAAALEQAGHTVVVIGNERHVCGLIAVADTVRPEAVGVIGDLRARGVEHLIMLTGDNRATAEAIARQVGIDEVHAELLPEDKVSAVEELVLKYGTVAMVGDGVNDAPAMARASLGIAMGAAGSDAAIETADIALMTDDLAKLPWLVEHSRRTLAIIRENIGFSLAIKALFVVLTFAGYATLWGAIAADVGASVLVVMNALRLLRGESLWLRERVAQLRGIGLTPMRLKVGALAALVLVYLASGLFTVQPGEVGVRQRFGEITAPDLAPGLHYRLPWPFESHKIVPTDLVRRAEFGFRSEAAAALGARALARDRLTVGGPSNPVPNTIKSRGFWFQKEAIPEESFLLTGDGNLVDLRLTVQYRVADPIAYAYRLAQPDQLVRSLALAAVRAVVATRDIDDLYTDQRGEVEDRVLETVQRRLDSYGAGIAMVAVRLLYVHPPEEVHGAFRDVASAEEDKLRTINRARTFAVEKVNLAEGEAAAMIERALAFKDERILEAHGEAAGFGLQADAYRDAPELTTFRLQLETIEEVLPGTRKFIRPGERDIDNFDLWLLKPVGGRDGN
ncbi:MAG: FtsH protease activity modulator HflK [Geminicoccaceae bacterium]